MAKQIRRLYRSKANRVLFGVCGGIGEYLEIDPVVVRVLWIFFTVLSFGVGILAYLLAAIVIPEKN